MSDCAHGGQATSQQRNEKPSNVVRPQYCAVIKVKNQTHTCAISNRHKIVCKQQWRLRGRVTNEAKEINSCVRNPLLHLLSNDKHPSKVRQEKLSAKHACTHPRRLTLVKISCLMPLVFRALSLFDEEEMTSNFVPYSSYDTHTM
eukprot:6004719-Amphidinium_carterae.1